MQITNNRTQYNNYNNFIPTKKKVINFTGNELQKTSNLGYNEINEIKRKFYMNIDSASNKEIANMLKRKASSLPTTINTMFYNIGMFLDASLETEDFVKNYCDLTEPLYRRIATGAEKEIFNESYAPEIDMLVKIRNIINDAKGDFKNKNLEVNINKLAKNYLKTPINRRKIFVQ